MEFITSYRETYIQERPITPGGGALPYKRLMEICRWIGSHFHDCIDYNGVAFSIELLEWGRSFSDFWGKKVVHIYGYETYQNICTVGEK